MLSNVNMRLFLAISLPVTVCCFGVRIDKLGPMLLELQDTMDLSCNATGCPEQATIIWRTIDDKPFKPIKEENGFVSFKSQALTNLELVCTAKCKDEQDVQKKMRIIVYSFPSDPEITGGDDLAEGVEQTLTCTARDIYPDEVTVEWLKGDQSNRDETPQKIDNSDGKVTVISKYTFTPTAQDNGGSITCKVIQIIDLERVITKNSTLPLTVNQYSIGDVHISGQLTLSIGETLKLTCNSKGNPPPVMMWKRVSTKVPSIINASTIVIKNTTWSDAGQYDCEAYNIVGRVNSSATVIIQGPPSNAEVRVSPSVELASGENVTITCFTISFPPATFTLFKQGQSQPLQSGNGTFHLLHLTQEDTGRYLINITNHLGHVTETFNLSITSSPILPTVVLPAVGSVSFLTVLLLLLRFLRNRKRSKDISSGIVDIVENAL